MMPTALITGATGGIGRALVEAFVAAEYWVVASDVTSKPADLGCGCYLQADLQQFAENSTYASTICMELTALLGGRGLNALINNAAVQILGATDNLTREDWRTSLDVNLMAPFLLTQALLPFLEQSGGCVINISSIHARLTKRNFVAYATTKAALSGMTRALAVDLGSRVRVNAIEPAAIDTPMLRAGFNEQESLYQQLEDCHPQGRIGTPHEVAKTALWLADGDIRFLHGTCIAVDGGISTRLFDPN